MIISFESCSRWNNAIIIVLFPLLIFSLGYWLFIQVNVEQYRFLKTQEVALQQDLGGVQRQVEQLQRYRHQLQQLKELVNKKMVTFVKKSEIPLLLDNISNIADSSSLHMEFLSLTPEISHDFYRELPIKMTLTGHYHQFELFFNRIASINQLITWHDFSLQVTKGGLIMKITASAYMSISDNRARPFESSHFKPLGSLSTDLNKTRQDPFKNHSIHFKQPLEVFSIDSLKLVGVLKQGNIHWGLIQQPDGLIRRIMMGDRLGLHQGLVIYVSDNSIEVKEPSGMKKTLKLT